MAGQVSVGGQLAWRHDGNSYGFFHTFDALNLEGDTRKVHVFVPHSYDSEKTKRYPVIYMNDGHTAFWAGGLTADSWEAQNTLAMLAEKNEIQEVIVVAVHPRDRTYEYTHSKWDDANVYGGLHQYIQYVSERVKPFIDKSYRTIPDASQTTIIGASFGGLAAFFIGNSHPEQFGIIGACSPSFWAGEDFLQDSTWQRGAPIENTTVGKLLANKKFEEGISRPKIWIDWGQPDNIFEVPVIERCQEMLKVLQNSFDYELNKNLFFFEDSIGGHSEAAWRFRFGLFAKTFYPAKNT